LEEAAPLAELDQWIEDYTRRQSRCTFTEEEALKALWDEEEEVRLREDSRFREVRLPQQGTAPQWQLAHHTLANQALYAALAGELWDGSDLFGFLAGLDRRAASLAFHVVALDDARFTVTEEQPGIFHLALRVTEGSLSLPHGESAPLSHEEQAILARIASSLLKAYPDLGSQPCTTRQVFDALQTLAGRPAALEAVPLEAIMEWLLHQEAWVRVGEEMWLRRDHLPTLAPRHRYAVAPVASSSGVSNPTLPQVIRENAPAFETSQPSEAAATTASAALSSNAKSWQVVLRTVHLNEGAIPVPPSVHALYPTARALANPSMLSGLWFDDGRVLTLWLDRTRHTLFGADLQDHFAFLEAGTILQVTWQAAGLTLHVLGADAQVAEEEARLVDLTSLAHLRSTLLESYRASLRAIFEEHGHPLSFQELYQALCQRQQHSPNSATIRTILSSSPEFAYLKSAGKWSLNPQIASEIGARALRRLRLAHQETLEVEGTMQMASTSPSLCEMLATHRHEIHALREHYLSEGR
jgi:hypothetical protein